MFCPNCGATVQGRFCAKCGTAVEAAAPAGSPSGAAPGAQPYATAPVAASGMSENVAGALCYLLTFITGVLFLVLPPYNQSKFVRFHAFQAIFFAAAFFILSITLSIASFVLPWYLMGMIWMVVQLGGLVLWLVLMFKAYNNERFKVPVIGDLAEKQA